MSDNSKGARRVSAKELRGAFGEAKGRVSVAVRNTVIAGTLIAAVVAAGSIAWDSQSGDASPIQTPTITSDVDLSDRMTAIDAQIGAADMGYADTQIHLDGTAITTFFQDRGDKAGALLDRIGSAPHNGVDPVALSITQHTQEIPDLDRKGYEIHYEAFRDRDGNIAGRAHVYLSRDIQNGDDLMAAAFGGVHPKTLLGANNGDLNLFSVAADLVAAHASSVREGRMSQEAFQNNMDMGNAAVRTALAMTAAFTLMADPNSPQGAALRQRAGIDSRTAFRTLQDSPMGQRMLFAVMESHGQSAADIYQASIDPRAFRNNEDPASRQTQGMERE